MTEITAFFIFLLTFPALYAFLFSLPFGIKKILDKLILFFLQNCSSILALTVLFFSSFNNQGTVYKAAILLLCVAVKTVADGLVWQFFLRDRKLNGFIIAIIGAVIYMLPVAWFIL